MPPSENSTHPQRPNWHVDAKWISGLLLFAVGSATLALFFLYLITRPAPAIDLAGSMLSAVTTGRSGPQEGSESPTPGSPTREDDLAAFVAQVEAAGEDGLRPFPGLDAVITIDDLQNRTAEEVSLLLFRQVAEQVYWRGPAAVESQGEGSSPLSALGLMAIFTNETHLRVWSLLLPLLGTDLILMCLLIFFSAGPGRLLNPGLVLTLSGAPGMVAAVFTISRLSGPQGAVSESPALLSGLQATLGSIAVSAIEVGLRGYLYSLSAGLLLIVLGLSYAIGRLLRRPMARAARAPASPPA